MAQTLPFLLMFRKAHVAKEKKETAQLHTYPAAEFSDPTKALVTGVVGFSCPSLTILLPEAVELIKDFGCTGCERNFK